MPPFSSMSRSFNSRLREEATSRTRGFVLMGAVSTHASVRRRREEYDYIPAAGKFQLTPP